MKFQSSQGCILSTSSLEKSFAEKKVVDCVSLNLKQGEIVGLLGPNGAGKTTFFYMVVGLLSPDCGKVFLDQKDITYNPLHKRAQKGLGYLPQNSSIFGKLSVKDNLIGVMQVLRFSKDKQKRVLEEMIARFKLSEVANSYGSSLSGGERRRVEIARALILEPLFLLLDEPFAGVDPVAVTDIQSMLVELKEKNIGVLITDHNVRETLGCCDRSYVLSQGKIIAQGTAQEIIHNHEVREQYLGKSFNL